MLFAGIYVRHYRPSTASNNVRRHLDMMSFAAFEMM